MVTLDSACGCARLMTITPVQCLSWNRHGLDGVDRVGPAVKWTIHDRNGRAMVDRKLY